MNRYRAALRPYLQDMISSFMFWICAGAPVAFTLFNRQVIPIANAWLSDRLDQADALVPYYEAIDAFVICTIAIMVGYTGVLVILDELDAGTAVYCTVTPLGKGGYLLSRLVVPVILAIGLNLLVVGMLVLSSMSVIHLVAHTMVGLLIGMAVAVFVLAFAHNRIEGIALTKIGNIFTLGIPIGTCLFGMDGLPFMWLPTFWIGRFAMEGHVTSILIATGLSLGWLVVFGRRFVRKLQ